MSRALTEEQVLKKLGIPNFRYMTKEKVVSFATMLPQIDPEVAKKLLDQFPEFSKSVLEIAKNYKDTLEKGLEENSSSTKICYETCNAIINSLTKLLEKQDLSHEERSDVINKMIELSKMVHEKDTENKQFILKVLAIAGATTFAVGGVVASVLGTNLDFNLPKKS